MNEPNAMSKKDTAGNAVGRPLVPRGFWIDRNCKVRISHDARRGLLGVLLIFLSLGVLVGPAEDSTKKVSPASACESAVGALCCRSACSAGAAAATDPSHKVSDDTPVWPYWLRAERVFDPPSWRQVLGFAWETLDETREISEPDLYDGVKSVLSTIGSLLLLITLLRWILWHEYWSRGRDHGGMNRDEKLLPSQKVFVTQLVSSLSEYSLERPGPLQAIQGNWGSGKSYLMGQLKEELEAFSDREIAAVYLHVWREQTERDLHLAIVDAVLSHRKVLFACFDAYPTRLLFRRIAHSLSTALPAGFRLNNGALDVLVDPDKAIPMLARHELERVVARACRQQLRIVVILDEVDRATVPVAQAAVALTRRALELPGVAVVLPYVGKQLRLKVFNPLNNYSPDLHQTFLVNIEAQTSDDGSERTMSDEERAMRDRNISGTERASLNAIEEAMKLERGAFDKEEPGTDKKRRVKNAWSAGREQWQFELLQRYYRLSANERKRLVEQSEEKYLSRCEYVPPLLKEDVYLILAFRSLRPVLKGGMPNDNLKQLLVAVLKPFEEHVINRSGGSPPSPVIRQLEGRLIRFLGAASNDPPKYPKVKIDGRESELPPEIKIAFLVLLAWRSAQLLGHGRD